MYNIYSYILYYMYNIYSFLFDIFYQEGSALKLFQCPSEDTKAGD